MFVVGFIFPILMIAVGVVVVFVIAVQGLLDQQPRASPPRATPYIRGQPRRRRPRRS